MGTLFWQYLLTVAGPALAVGMDALVTCHTARGHLTPQSVAHRSLQGGPRCVGGQKALVVAGGLLARGYQ